MDFENLFDIGGNEREADQVKKHQKSKDEIDRYSVEENMNDVDRAIFLLKKGTSTQKLSLLQGCVQQIFPYALRLNDGSAPTINPPLSSSSAPSSSLTPLMILDKLLPYLSSLCTPTTAPVDSSSATVFTEEHQATLDALLAIGCATNLFPPSIVSTRIIPIFLRLFTKHTTESMVQCVGEHITTLIIRNTVTLTCIQNDILPTTLTMGNVANTPQQRILAVKVLLGIVTHFSTALIPSPDSSTMTNNLNTFLPIIESLLSFCQDTESRIRTLLASSLSNMVASLWFAVPMSALSSNIVFMAVSRCRDRCIEELFELVGDEDTIVRTAAMESTIDLSFRQDNKYLPRDRRNELWELLRKQWEHLTSSSSLSTPDSAKDDQMRVMFAQRSGRIFTILLSPFIDYFTSSRTAVNEGNAKGTDPNSSNLATTNDESTARQRRITRRASATGNALLPLNDSNDNNKGSASSSNVSLVQQANIFQSFVQFFQSLTNHKSEDIRLPCVRSLPGIFTALTLTLGPVPSSSASLNTSHVSVTASSASSSSTGTMASNSTEDKPSLLSSLPIRRLPATVASSGSSSSTAKPTIAVPANRTPVEISPSPSSGVSLLSSLSGSNGTNRDDDVHTDIFFTPLPKLTSTYHTFLHSSPSSTTTITNETLTIIGAYHLRTFALPYIHRLVTDTSIPLRQTVANLFHHIVATVGYGRATRCLTPYLYTLLNDHDDTVVRTVILTSHIWLPYLTCPDPILRLQMGALIIPSLFHAILRPSLKVLWRVQIAFLATLRWLVFIYPAPNVMEACLTLCHRYIVTGCKGVRASAIHTLVWYSRHAPTARVRNAAKEYIVGQFATCRTLRSQIAHTLVQNHPLAPGTQPGTSPSSAVSSVASKSGTTFTDMTNTLSGTTPINLGNGYMIPLEAALDILCPLNTSSKVIAPPVPNVSVTASTGPSSSSLPVSMPLPSLSGPAWRRECIIEACGASLWLYSRTYVKTTFLPSVLDSALYDPVISVRTTAIRSLAYLRSWFVLPTDNTVIDSIRSTLEMCSKDPRKTISTLASQQIQLLRKYDSSIVQAYLHMHQSSPTLFPLTYLPSLVVYADTLPVEKTVLGNGTNNIVSPVSTPGPAVEVLNPVTIPAGRRRSSINKNVLNAATMDNLTSSPARSSIAPSVITPTNASFPVVNPTVPAEVIGKVAVLVALTVAANDASVFGKESILTVNPGQRLKSQFFIDIPLGGGSTGTDTCTCTVTPANEDSRGTGSTVQPDTLTPSTLPTKLWLENTILPLVDGTDGIYNSSVFLRNPFRINVTRSLPVIPVQTCYNGILLSTLNNKNTNTVANGYIELDNIVGLQTGITLWDCQCLLHSTHSATTNSNSGNGTSNTVPKPASPTLCLCSVAGTYVHKTVGNQHTLTSSTWYDNATIVRTQMEEIEEGILGRLYMPRDNASSFGSNSAISSFVPTVPSSTTFTNPVNCSLVQSLYHPFQLLCPVPHSPTEETFRLSCENALGSSATGGMNNLNDEEILDKRTNSKKGPIVTGSTNNALSSITDVLASPRISMNESLSPVSSFSPIGWPASLAPAVGNIASGAIPLSSPFILAPPSLNGSTDTTPRSPTNNALGSTLTLPSPLPAPHNALITLPAGLQIGNNGPVSVGGITLQLQANFGSSAFLPSLTNSGSSSNSSSNGTSGNSTPSAATKSGTTGTSLSLLNGKNVPVNNSGSVNTSSKGSVVPNPLNSNDNINTVSGTSIYTSLLQVPFTQFLIQSALTPNLIATNLHSLQHHPSIQPIPLSLTTPNTGASSNGLSNSTVTPIHSSVSTSTSTTKLLTSMRTVSVTSSATNLGNNNDSLASLTNRLSSNNGVNSSGSTGSTTTTNASLPFSASRAPVRVSITPASTSTPSTVASTAITGTIGKTVSGTATTPTNDISNTFGSRRTISALASAGSKVSSTTGSSSVMVPSSGSALPPTHSTVPRLTHTTSSTVTGHTTIVSNSSIPHNNNSDVLSRLLNSTTTNNSATTPTGNTPSLSGITNSTTVHGSNRAGAPSSTTNPSSSVGSTVKSSSTIPPTGTGTTTTTKSSINSSVRKI